MKVRRLFRLCKLASRGSLFAVFAALLTACAAPRGITVETLQQAPRTPLRGQRLVISDVTALGPAYKTLSPRLGLLVVGTDAEWRALAAVCPNVGDRPDLTRGTVVGLVSRAGTPVDGGWPIQLDAIRLSGSGGWIEGTFHPATYQPDSAAYAETAYVPGLGTVLVVEINGLFYEP